MPFVLFNKRTGDFFPCIPGAHQTHVEFVSISKRPPRLFQTSRLANWFLTVWCKGPMIHKSERGSTSDWFDEGPIRERNEHNPDIENPRVRDDYDIVEVQLSLLWRIHAE